MDKKKILKIGALIVGIVVLYFLGSKLYMAKFYNYKQDVKNALDLYKKGDTDQLHQIQQNVFEEKHLSPDGIIQKFLGL